MTHLLFTYGTLMQEVRHPMGEWLAQCSECLGEAWVSGQLYDLGNYPGLSYLPQGRARVYGQLHRLYDPVASLVVLDQYEGITGAQTDEYVRHQINVEQPQQSVLAWAYLLPQVATDWTLITCGNYRTYLQERVARRQAVDLGSAGEGPPKLG